MKLSTKIKNAAGYIMSGIGITLATTGMVFGPDVAVKYGMKNESHKHGIIRKIIGYTFITPGLFLLVHGTNMIEKEEST